MMISIKRLLEQRRSGGGPAPDHDIVEALTQMVRLLLDAMATHMVRGNEVDFRALGRSLNSLSRQLEGPQSAMALLGISSDAVSSLEDYCQRTSAYFRAQNEERQSMVAMLTDTVADLAGQADSSVSRLQAIEKQVERASALDDIRTLRSSLGESLQGLRDAVAQQRSASAATVECLQGQLALARSAAPDDSKQPSGGYTDIDLIPETSDPSMESLPSSYVAAFRLQRAEHIANRFGETVKHQMLTMIATQLKALLGPGDRLLRWKGTSFVMFISSPAPIHEIRARLADTVAATGQQFIEVGRKTALLSVGVDWIVFPQSKKPSLDAVFAEVDAFLENGQQSASPVMSRRGARPIGFEAT